jgi:hypothetical protein
VSCVGCESGNASSAEAGPTCESGNASSAQTVPPVESPLPPISLPAELPVPPHAPEDSRSDQASPPRLEAMAAVSDDSASAPSVKRQRQLPASSSCAHSKSLAPPFHKDACGNHLRDKSRILAVWGRKGRNQLPKSYWDDKCPEMPSIDFVLEFFQFRHDRNGAAMSNKLGKPEQQEKGWWRIPILPITSPGKSSGEQWSTAWHGTIFSCLYSILYHDELLESNKEGHMKKDLQGVYCHKPGTSRKAENYVVFENVFSNGHWWGALLELSVDRAVGKTVGDQWVQPAESVILKALWVCGRHHDQMTDQTCFWVSPWDPEVEVNPSTIFADGVTPLRAKRDKQAFKTEQIGQALTRSLPVYGSPSTETLIIEAEQEAAALQARWSDALDDTEGFEPDWDDAADQDSTATPWSLSNSAAVVDPTVYLAVAPTRACEWCWSPEAPLCSDCMISMKQKKGRALDVDARWRLTGASDDISEEAQRQMSRDATDWFGTPEYSQLSELFGAIDVATDKDTFLASVKHYLVSMSQRSHRANALANGKIDGEFRQADPFLRDRCAKLIEELPDASLEKHNLTNESSAEKRWEAVARLVTQYIGEVRILQPESATWKLCEVHQWNGLSEELLVRQFQIQLDGGPEDFASSWLGHNAKIGLEAQVRTTASDKRIDQAALRPCWAKQTMRVVAPVTLPEACWPPMEWRLDGTVATIGELLLRLGGTRDSFARFNY